MNERGFTLLESLVALAILGIVLAGVTRAFLDNVDVTTRNEERSGAIAAAQQYIETARNEDPSTLPSSGTSSPEIVSMDGRDFEVVTSYCVADQFCSTNSRHLTIEVSYGGRRVYTTESVFTKLR